MEEIKQQIQNCLENVDHVQIHCQPQEKTYRILALPLAEDRRSISEHFGDAPYYRIVKYSSRNWDLISDAVITNPQVQEEKAKGIKVANWLLSQGVDMLLVHKELEGRGPGYVLGDAEVEIKVVGETSADQVIGAIKASRQSGKMGFFLNG